MTPVPSRSSVCLAMLVRDEADVIERAIASARRFVDSFIVIDAGSRDDTVARARRALGQLPGELRSSPWRDFGSNRTELVTAARGAAEWLLVLDADMTLEGPPAALDALGGLEADAALVRVDDGRRRGRAPCVLRGDKDWYYRGSVHERLGCGQVFSSAPLDALRVVHHRDGRSRNTRLSEDLALLHADLARDPDEPRALFYLAETLRELGERERAIESYRRRLTLGGLVDEVFSAHYQIGLLLEPVSSEESGDALLGAWETAPERAEPLYHLARQNRLRGRHHVAWSFARRAQELRPPDGASFLEPWVYACGVPFELADAAWRVGEEDLALEVAGRLLAAGPDRIHLPAEYRSHLELIAGRAGLPR